MSLPDGRYFKAAEFAQKARFGLPVTPYPEEWLERWLALVGLCDAIREAWGGPIIVISGYRSPAYNQALIEADAASGARGVASGSKHPKGEAADLRPEKADAGGLYRVISSKYDAGELPGLGGIGFYPRSNWVHVDVAKAADGHLRRWLGT